MLSPQEKDRMRDVEQALHQTMEMFGEAATPELQAIIVGALLATVDLLFAIRDGEPWRGMTDPQEMTRALLREIQLGD